MIDLPIKKLREGMITAQGIYNSQGASYLTKGTSLNKHYIARLGKIGIPNVNVTSIDPTLTLPPPDDIVQEKTRITAIHRVFGTFQSLEKSGLCSVGGLHDISESILMDLITQRKNLVQLTDLRLHDDYTFSHSVNVAILSTMLGLLCHYSKGTLLTLMLSGFLHDIGKTTISAKILNKPYGLTSKELELIHTHPAAGGQKLRTQTNLPSLIEKIALQHHERLDGSGYPNALTGNDIHRFSRIVAIADVYDALTSNRPYKKAYSPSVAYQIMTKCSKGQFDEELLQLFFDNVAVYPVGTIIRTLLGYGIVKKIKSGQTKTPVICLFANKNGCMIHRPMSIDLCQCPPDMIQQVLEGSELYHFVHQIQTDPAKYLKEE